MRQRSGRPKTRGIESPRLRPLLSSRALFVGAPFERPFVDESGIGTAYCFE
jgi:hypothetical protein